MTSIDVGDARDFMDRIYLFVFPEEYPQVQASGACWDDASKSWYIGEGMELARFSRWLGEEEGEAPFGIVSEEAFAASARSPCVRCGNEIEVVCIYCKSGMDTEIDNPIADFTVFNIWAMDGVLATLIERWPRYRQRVDEDAEEGVFANHCAHCGAMQEDYLLHAEPGDVFFGLAMDAPGAVEFTALEGRVCMSGDYGFGV
jgi:Domain of unknown function (DUF5710)